MSPDDRVHELARSCQEQFIECATHPGLYRVVPLLRSVEGDFNIWCSMSGAAGGTSVPQLKAVDNEASCEQIIGLLSELSALLSDCKRVADEKDEDGANSTHPSTSSDPSGNQDFLDSNDHLMQSIPRSEKVEEDDTRLSLFEEEISYMIAIVTRLHRGTEEHYNDADFLQIKDVVKDDEGIIIFRRHLEHLIRTEASFTDTKSGNQKLSDTQAEVRKLTYIQTRFIDINVLRKCLLELQVGSVTKDTISNDIIRPYSCFVEDCHHPYEMFATSEALLSHMFEEHSSMRWTCEYCALEDRTRQEPPLFHDARDWELHVQENHPNLVTPIQGAIWAQLIGERVIGPQVCPFCDFGTTRAESEIDQHILQHIYDFSSLALPKRSAALAHSPEDPHKNYTAFSESHRIPLRSQDVEFSNDSPKASVSAPHRKSPLSALMFRKKPTEVSLASRSSSAVVTASMTYRNQGQLKEAKELDVQVMERPIVQGSTPLGPVGDQDEEPPIDEEAMIGALWKLIERLHLLISQRSFLLAVCLFGSLSLSAYFLPKDELSQGDDAFPRMLAKELPQGHLEVSWQSLFWGLFALALNSMMQPAGSVSGADANISLLLRSSPIICIIDSVLVLVHLAVDYCNTSSFQEAHDRLIRHRFQTDIYLGSEKFESSWFFRLAVAMFALTQFIKIFAFGGVVWTKIIATLYLGSFLIIEALVVWPVASKQGDKAIMESRFSSTAYVPVSLAVVFLLGLATVVSRDIFGKHHSLDSLGITWTMFSLGFFFLEARTWKQVRTSAILLFLTLGRIYFIKLQGVPVLLHWLLFNSILLNGLKSLETIRQPVLKSLGTIRQPGKYSESKKLEQAMAWYFCLLHLSTALLYYRFSYDATGTTKPTWVEYIG